MILAACSVQYDDLQPRGICIFIKLKMTDKLISQPQSQQYIESIQNNQEKSQLSQNKHTFSYKFRETLQKFAKLANKKYKPGSFDQEKLLKNVLSYLKDRITILAQLNMQKKMPNKQLRLYEQLQMLIKCRNTIDHLLKTQEKILQQRLGDQLNYIYQIYCEILAKENIKGYYMLFQDLQRRRSSYLDFCLTQSNQDRFDAWICAIVACYNLNIKINRQIQSQRKNTQGQKNIFIHFNEIQEEIEIVYDISKSRQFKRFSLRAYYTFSENQLKTKQSLIQKAHIIFKRMLLRTCQQIIHTSNQTQCDCELRICPQLPTSIDKETHLSNNFCLNKGFTLISVLFLFFHERLLLTKFRFCYHIKEVKDLRQFFASLKSYVNTQKLFVIIQQGFHSYLIDQILEQSSRYCGKQETFYYLMQSNGNFEFNKIAKQIESLNYDSQQYTQHFRQILKKNNAQPIMIDIIGSRSFQQPYSQILESTQKYFDQNGLQVVPLQLMSQLKQALELRVLNIISNNQQGTNYQQYSDLKHLYAWCSQKYKKAEKICLEAVSQTHSIKNPIRFNLEEQVEQPVQKTEQMYEQRMEQSYIPFEAEHQGLINKK